MAGLLKTDTALRAGTATLELVPFTSVNLFHSPALERRLARSAGAESDLARSVYGNSLLRAPEKSYIPGMTNPEMKSPDLPTVDQVTTILQSTIGQIRFVRDYTLELLEATPRDRWFEMPVGAVSHIAWQVGHLTVSQYGLLMFRIRGRHPEDLDLIPGRFRKTYGRGGKPPMDAEGQPTPEELLDRMNQVYELAIDEISLVNPEDLLESVDMPYAVYPCKLGAVMFCPLHENLHAGQIGLLRRGLGLESVR